jgi:hypothetical protein
MKIILKSLLFGMVTESATWWGLGYLYARFSSDILSLLMFILHLPAFILSDFIPPGAPYGFAVGFIVEALLWSLIWGFIFYLVESGKKARERIAEVNNLTKPSACSR